MANEAGARRAIHPYHMYEAIRQQPDRIARVLETGRELVERAADAAAGRRRLVLAGIGTSYHAAQVTDQFVRHLTGGRVAALVEQSFELVHYPLALSAEDVFVVISHRGWKNYSVQALRAARAAGALTIAVTGQEAGAGMAAADFVLTTCEQEISFGHTKSYTTAIAALALFTIRLAERRGLLADPAAAQAALATIPGQMREALDCEPQAHAAAREIARRQRWIFLGAGPNWATAREGALKVKETSYLASEGFETEQFLHGPLAELDSRAVLTALYTGGPGDARLAQAAAAVGELGVLRVAVAVQEATRGAAEHVLEVPKVPEWLSPFVQVVPLQLLGYFVAIERGCNPDTGREEQPAHARAREHFQL